MKFPYFLLVLALSIPAAAQAASLTCSDIEKSAKDHTLRKSAFKSATAPVKVMKTRLFLKALALANVETDKPIDQTPLKDLLDQFDPLFANYTIAGKTFQAVNLSLGDNPYVYLFDLDQETFSGIVSEDGSVAAGGEYCDTGSDVLN